MAALWFVRGNGKVYGPLDSARLKQIAAEGKINEATEVAQNQAGPWHPAGKVRGLFDAASSTSTLTQSTQNYPTQQQYAPPQYTAPQPTPDATEAPAATPIINVTRRAIATYYPRSQTGMIATVAGLCSVASLVLGYFAGREHLRYQIRSSFEDAGKKFAKDLKEGIGKAFAGEAAAEDAKKPEPVAKLKIGQAYNTPESSFAVTSARMEHPLLKGGFRNTTMKHDEECLVVALTIRNKDSRKQLKLSYGHQFTGKVFAMYDDVGNEIDTMFFSSPGSDFQIVGSHPSYKDVDPEQTIEHFVAFQSPLPKTKAVSLLIDKKLVGQDGVVQYDIPVDAVDGFKGQ